jgi:hypothetical protein
VTTAASSKEIDPARCRTGMLTRFDVARVLRRWQAGELSSDQVRRWASACYFSDHVDYADWEGDHSVVCEILAFLDVMERSGGAEQAAPYLEFLTTPKGQFEEGYSRFQNKLNRLNRSVALPSPKQKVGSLSKLQFSGG